MSLKFARVRFEGESIFYVKPIKDIKEEYKDDTHIKPRRADDFDPTKTYYCKQDNCDAQKCEEMHDHSDYYPCIIHLLGVSEQDIKNQLHPGSKRKSIPKLQHDLGDLGEITTNKKLKVNEKKVLEKRKNIVQKRRSQMIIRRLKKFSDSDSDTDGDNGTESKLDFMIRENNRLREEIEAFKSFKSTDIETSKAIPFTLAQDLEKQRGISTPPFRSVRESAVPSNSRQSPASTIAADTDTSSHKNPSKDLTLRGSQTSDKESETDESLSLRFQISDEECETNDTNTFLSDEDSVAKGNNISSRNKYSLTRTEAPKLRFQTSKEDNETEDNNVFSKNNSSLTRSKTPKSRFPTSNRDNETEDGLADNEKQGKEKIKNLILSSIQYYSEGGRGHQDFNKRYSITRDKVYLGEGKYVNVIAWSLMNQKKPSIFLRELLVTVWSESELTERAVDPSKVRDSANVQVLEGHLLRLIYSLYNDFLNKKKFSAQERAKYLSDTTVLITRKIYELKRQKACKNN